MALPSHPLREHYFLWGLLALLFLISATYRALDISERIGELRHGREYAREPFDINLPEYDLTGVEAEATEAGLQRGDTIRAFNGNRVHYSAADLWLPLRNARAGERLRVDATRVVEHRPVTISAAIVLRPVRTGAPTALEIASFLVLNIALPVICAALGFWVAAARIHDGRAWLLLFLVLSLAEFGGANFRFLYGRQDAFQPIAAAYQPLLANFWPTAMFLFAIYFPDRLQIDRRVPWLKWVVIAPIAIRVVALNPVFEYIAYRSPEAALDLHRRLQPTQAYLAAAYPLFILLFFAIMTYRTVTERQPDARRRLLLLDAGAALSVMPLLMFVVLFYAGRRNFSDWAFFPILGFLVFFPLTMAYVIVVHRAMDVRIVVRQGVQYVLARGGIRVIQLALIAGASITATSMLSGGAGTLRVVLVVAGMVAIVASGRRFADRLGRWVDRRFFREAYDAEQILSELAMQVRTMVETRPLLQTVAHRVAETLHVPEVAILLNDGGRLQPAYSLGYADLPHVAIPEESVTVRRLQRDPHMRVRFDDPQSWVHDVSAEERESLSALRSDVLLPLSLNQKMLGVMSLGPKRSEEPYSSSDLRMLGLVATQTGLALENSRLTAEVGAQIAEREKRQRELEIAREVQQRLFPQACPPVAGLEYAGACRPALEVGGDYYDFVTLSPTELGIAVGDVSGKGIPAALLMATLRAFLRGQTAGGDVNLAEMMLNLNALVFESSPANRYATFFFGRYDSATRVMEYVNAGHNPPMIFRACGRHAPAVIRLDTGGPVIGLLPACAYQQGSVTLATGDVLVAFTDGVSEAMNSNDQEWGEERLAEAVMSGCALEPMALIGRIMSAADRFVGGAPQHDDMTLVVLRCG